MRKVVIIILTILACRVDPKVKARSVLEEGLKDESEKVRVNAAGALTRLGDSKAKDLLIQFLRSDDDELVAIAVNKFARIPDTINGRYLRPLLEHRSPLVRRLVIEAMARIGIVEPGIVKMLSGKSVPIIVAACHYCGRMKLKRAIPYLKRLRRRKEPEVRIAAAIGLGLLGDRWASEQLKKEMAVKDPTIWEEAIRGLGIIRDTSSIQFLGEIVDEGIWPLDLIAAEALFRMGRGKEEVLIGGLTHKDPMVRIRTIGVVNEVGDERMLHYVLPLTEDPFLNVAIQAIDFVARYKRPEVKKKLASLLTAPNPYIRIAAAEAYLLGY